MKDSNSELNDIRKVKACEFNRHKFETLVLKVNVQFGKLKAIFESSPLPDENQDLYESTKIISRFKELVKNLESTLIKIVYSIYVAVSIAARNDTNTPEIITDTVAITCKLLSNLRKKFKAFDNDDFLQSSITILTRVFVLYPLLNQRCKCMGDWRSEHIKLDPDIVKQLHKLRDALSPESAITEISTAETETKSELDAQYIELNEEASESQHFLNEEVERKSLLKELPLELLFHVLRFISPKFAGQIALVNHFLKSISEDNSLWKTHYHRDFTGSKLELLLIYVNLYLSLPKEKQDQLTFSYKQIYADITKMSDSDAQTIVNLLNRYIMFKEKRYLNSALLEAARFGALFCCKLLHQMNADLNTENEKNNTPIHRAAHWGQLDIVEWFVDNNVSITAFGCRGAKPLHIAAIMGDKSTQSVCDFLLRKGVEVDIKDNDNMTPLHYAAKYSAVSPEYPSGTIELLFAHGANPYAEDKQKQTPIADAKHKGTRQCIELLSIYEDTLTQYSTIIDLTDDQSKTETPDSFYHHLSDEILLEMESLTPSHLKADALDNIFWQEKFGRNFATQNGNPLLDYIATKQTVVMQKNQALEVNYFKLYLYFFNLRIIYDFIMKRGSHTVFSSSANKAFWLNLKIAVEGVATFSSSKGYHHFRKPIYNAVRSNRIDFIKACMYFNDVTVRASVDNGKKLLHLAAEFGFVEMCKFLITSGANVEAIDSEGRTPLYFAIENEHTDIIDMLPVESAVIYPARRIPIPSFRSSRSTYVDYRKTFAWAVKNRELGIVHRILQYYSGAAKLNRAGRHRLLAGEIVYEYLPTLDSYVRKWVKSNDLEILLICCQSRYQTLEGLFKIIHNKQLLVRLGEALLESNAAVQLVYFDAVCSNNYNFIKWLFENFHNKLTVSSIGDPSTRGRKFRVHRTRDEYYLKRLLQILSWANKNRELSVIRIILFDFSSGTRLIRRGLYHDHGKIPTNYVKLFQCLDDYFKCWLQNNDVELLILYYQSGYSKVENLFDETQDQKLAISVSESLVSNKSITDKNLQKLILNIVETNKLNVVKWFIKKFGDRIGQKNYQDAINKAASGGYFEIFKYLVKRNNFPLSYPQITRFFYSALICGHSLIFQFNRDNIPFHYRYYLKKTRSCRSVVIHGERYVINRTTLIVSRYYPPELICDDCDAQLDYLSIIQFLVKKIGVDPDSPFLLSGYKTSSVTSPLESLLFILIPVRYGILRKPPIDFHKSLLYLYNQSNEENRTKALELIQKFIVGFFDSKINRVSATPILSHLAWFISSLTPDQELKRDIKLRLLEICYRAIPTCVASGMTSKLIDDRARDCMYMLHKLGITAKCPELVLRGPIPYTEIDLKRYGKHSPEYLAVNTQYQVYRHLSLLFYSKYTKYKKTDIQDKIPELYAATADAQNRTPLINAILRSNIDDIREFLVLSNPVAINHQDNDGNTALHYAASEGFAKLVCQLITAGAKTYIENTARELPYQFSREPYMKFLILFIDSLQQKDEINLNVLCEANPKRLSQLIDGLINSKYFHELISSASFARIRYLTDCYKAFHKNSGNLNYHEAEQKTSEHNRMHMKVTDNLQLLEYIYEKNITKGRSGFWNWFRGEVNTPSTRNTKLPLPLSRPHLNAN